MTIKATDDLARAAGADAANRRMRAAGRTKWTRADFNLAARTYRKIAPCFFCDGIGENHTEICVEASA